MKPSLTDAIEKALGREGRLISGSKSGYIQANPTHKVYFNACIYDETPRQIWWGDVDITKDRRTLEKVAKQSGRLFYLTPELPFRSDLFGTSPIERLNEDERVIKFGGRREEAGHVRAMS